MDTLLQQPLKAPPRIKGLFLVGNTFDFLKDPLQFIVNAMHQCPAVVHVNIASRDVYMPFRQEDVKYVLQENNRNYTKSEAYDVIRLFLGNGLVTSEGDFWRRQRKLAQPAFYKQRLSLLVDLMNQSTLAMLARWEELDPFRPVDISNEMMKITLEIVSKSLFSTDVKKHLDHISGALTTVIEYAFDTMSSFIRIPLKYPTPRNVKFTKAVNQLEGIFYEIINSRQHTNPEDHDDLLGMLMSAKDEDTGEGMSIQQLRDEVATIFMAGHETTANALSWTLYLLASHPESVHKLRQEVTEVLGHEGLPTYENIRDLKYTMQVIQESMRLYPPVYVIGRKTIEEDEIGGYRIPAGVTIMISAYAIHRNPEYWDKPDVFDPDNFLPERIKDRPSYAYFPFGGGPRLCIGNNFAMMEMQIILALLIRQYDFALPFRQLKVYPEPTVTLRPKDGLKLRISKLR